ncbi:HD domain-containing phosphohydrolase [Paenibacillus agricola]|uniref:HD domain-containing protein n=1 Tax=Paenibacillus agricola TaxID=2716264 RepID=A0ABX0JJ23_9BACL|nr:HD domain-containing phosphohydrolase [Paenibacillus agricola]NHN34753.1 HD domain-containing protein [Paenibacillus agricola]
MTVYRTFLSKLARNYFLGSFFTTLGVGGVLIYLVTPPDDVERNALFTIFFISLAGMVTLNQLTLYHQLRPIRIYFKHSEANYEMLKAAYVQTHRFAILTAKRILGPSVLGFFLTAACTISIARYGEWLHIPSRYLFYYSVGALLITVIHAMLQFFLASETIRPLLIYLRNDSNHRFGKDISLDGNVLLSLRAKFLCFSLIIGISPILLFSLVARLRYEENASSDSFWQWAGIIIGFGIVLSVVYGWLFSRNIQRPIDQLQYVMNELNKSELEIKASDIYSDEFSRLVSGFNGMVEGLRERDSQNNQLVESYYSTLAAALDARDPYTAGHSERVARYSIRIGQWAGLSPLQLEMLKKTALLHDIGKIGVPDSVLHKEGKLTIEEFNLIKLHPVLGESILRRVQPERAMAPLLPGVRSHHERYDGGGYPDGLEGEGIPLFGRIIAVADAFDAMTSDRPYRKGMSFEEALLILRQGKGSQWDPMLVQLFIDNVETEALECDLSNKTISYGKTKR